MSETSERQMFVLKDQKFDGCWSPSTPTKGSLPPTSGSKSGKNIDNSSGASLDVESCESNSSSGSSSPSSSVVSKNFKVAVDIMIRWYRAFGGSVRAEELKNFVNCFMEEVSRLQGSCVKLRNTPTSSNGNGGGILANLDLLCCPICFGILTQPVTALCGHSYCRKCLGNEKAGGSSCRRCRHVFTSVDIGKCKTDVVSGSLLEKCWAKDLQAAKARTEGNTYFEANDRDRALAKYSQALSLVPTDHLTLGNLSHVLLTLGRSEEALTEIDAAIRACPFWGKGYFRKAAVLISLGRYEEAFVNLAVCASLVMLGRPHQDASMTPVKAELLKVLHRIFLVGSGGGSGAGGGSMRHSSTSIRRHSSDPSSGGYCPYPNLKYHRPAGSERSTESETETSSVDEDGGQSSPEHQPHHRHNHHHHSYHHHHHHRESSGGKISASSSILLRKRNNSNAESNKLMKLSSSTSSIGQQAQAARVSRIFERALADVKRKYTEVLSSEREVRIERPVDPNNVLSASDLECTLCYRLLHEPITTVCGHTYCRSCLERTMDHSTLCPLCKTSLEDFMGHRKPAVNQFIQTAIAQFLPREHAERVQQHLEDIAAEVSGSEKSDKEAEIPIFVCTMAFPSVPCPLHVFEPKYRLMIRRCMESGTRRFGMCCYVEGGEYSYGDVGTLLEIQNVQYFPDGRSVVDTVGRRRFKVLSKSLRDGYNVAKIELLQDRPPEPAQIPQITAIHDQVYAEAKEWLDSVGQVLRQRIVTHFGTMPAPEENWLESTDGPAWTWWLLAILPLVSKAQLAILGMTSLQKRLESIQKVLHYVKAKQT